MDFRIRQLQCFLTLAELLHYGRTARALYMSQPTITFQIKSLEQAFGVPLFERNRQQVSLSRAGLEFRPYAQNIVDTVREAQSRLGEVGSELRLRISCGAIGQALLLPTILRTLAARYPGFDLQISELTTEQQITGLSERKIDALLMVEPLPVKGMRFECLREDSLGVILHRLNPLAARRILSIQDLRESALVVPRLEDSSIRQPFLRSLLAEHGITPSFLEAPHSLSAQLAYVAAGEGVIVGTRYRIGGHPDVVFRPFRERLPRLQLGFAYLSSNVTPALETFRSLVMENTVRRPSPYRSTPEPQRWPLSEPAAHPAPLS
ncbi:LysR family transcriptional regulator [Granulicella sibirica]|uniref:LysR-family transcriptional regulatory protein n=1 Tax=Granulicella sibirica TaxID=2479048 RepID=A0A4V1L5M3_9BACT|nr:LysR substrate-binding domain-containing protein [Granulicella sibirica]RXH56264.1 LysR-family transcriptional regulatory protein [Granulicella sibirica]